MPHHASPPPAAPPPFYVEVPIRAYHAHWDEAVHLGRLTLFFFEWVPICLSTDQPAVLRLWVRLLRGGAAGAAAAAGHPYYYYHRGEVGISSGWERSAGGCHWDGGSRLEPERAGAAKPRNVPVPEVRESNDPTGPEPDGQPNSPQ